MTHPFLASFNESPEEHPFLASFGGSGTDPRLGTAIGRYEHEQGNIAQNLQALKDQRAKADPAQWPQLDRLIAALEKQDDEMWGKGTRARSQADEDKKAAFPGTHMQENVVRGIASGIARGPVVIGEMIANIPSFVSGGTLGFARPLSRKLTEQGRLITETLDPQGIAGSVGELAGELPANMLAFEGMAQAVPGLKPWLMKEIEGSLVKRLGVSAAKNTIAATPFSALMAAGMEDASFAEKTKQFLIMQGAAGLFGLLTPAPKATARGGKTPGMVGGEVPLDAPSGATEVPVLEARQAELDAINVKVEAQKAAREALRQDTKLARATWELANPEKSWKGDLTNKDRSGIVREFQIKKATEAPVVPAQKPVITPVEQQAVIAATRELSHAEAGGTAEAITAASAKLAKVQADATRVTPAPAPVVEPTRPIMDKPQGGVAPAVAEVRRKMELRAAFKAAALPFDEAAPLADLEAQFSAAISGSTQIAPQQGPLMSRTQIEAADLPPHKPLSELDTGNPDVAFPAEPVPNPVADAIYDEIKAKLNADGNPSGAAYEAFVTKHADLFDRWDEATGVKPAPGTDASPIAPNPADGTSVPASPAVAVAVAEQKPAGTRLKYVKFEKDLETLTNRDLDAVETKLVNMVDRVGGDKVKTKKILSDLSRIRDEMARRSNEAPPTVERPHAALTPDELQVHRDAIEVKLEELSAQLHTVSTKERAPLRALQKETKLRMEEIQKEINFRRANPPEGPVSKMKTGEGTVGAGFDKSLFKKLGSNMYSGDLGVIAIKEALQNATDSVRGEPGATIHVDFQPAGESIQPIAESYLPDYVEKPNIKHGGILTVTDNGRGMSPEVMETALVDIGGSFKDAQGSSGGYGLAKVALFSRAADIDVVSVHRNADGELIRTTLKGSGHDWVEGNMKLDSKPMVDMEVLYKEYDQWLRQNKDLPSLSAEELLLEGVTNPAQTKFLKEFISKWEIAQETKATGTTMKIAFEPDVQPNNRLMSEFLHKYISTSTTEAKVTANVKSTWGNVENFDSPPQSLTEKTPIKSVEVPGSHIDFYRSTDVRPGDAGYIEMHVLNNGIFQFSQSMHIEGEGVPSWFVADVKSSVDVNSPEYPFTTSRESLKKAAAQEVTNFFENLNDMARQSEIDKIDNAIQNATPITGTSFKVYVSDMEQDGALARQLAEAPWVSQLVDGISEMQDLIMDAASERGRVLEAPEFGGIGIDSGWLGINISHGRLQQMRNDLTGVHNTIKTPNTILLNPFAIYREVVAQVSEPFQIAARMAEQTWATMIHEVAHQRARGHNAEFAGFHTRLMGDVGMVNSKSRIAALHDVYEQALQSGQFEESYMSVSNSWSRVQENDTGIFGKIGDTNVSRTSTVSGHSKRGSGAELRSEMGQGDRENVQGQRLSDSRNLSEGSAERSLAGSEGSEPAVTVAIDFHRAPSKLGNVDLDTQIAEIHRRLEIIDPQDAGPWSQRLTALMEESASRIPDKVGPEGMPPIQIGRGELRIQSHPAVTSFAGGFAYGLATPQEGATDEEYLSRAFMYGVGSAGLVMGGKYLLARQKAIATAPKSTTIPGSENFPKRVYSAEELEGPKFGPLTRLRQFYQGIARSVDGIERTPYKKGLPTQKDPGKLAEMYGSYMTQVERWFTTAVDFINPETGMPEPILVKGRPVLPLKQIEAMAQGDREALGELATAYGVMELSGKYKPEQLPMTIEHATYLITHAPDYLVEAVKELRRFHLAGPVVQNKMGLISDETLLRFESEDWYSPMHRVVEQMEGLAKTRTDRVPAKSALYERKGGSNKPVLNPVDVAMNMTTRILRSAEYNNILKTYIERVKELPKELRDVMVSPAGKQLSKHAVNVDAGVVELRKWVDISLSDAKGMLAYMDSEAINGKPGIVSYFLNGEIQSYRVNSDVFQAVKALSPPELEMAWRVIGAPARFASKGVVYHPGFTEAQFIMDSFTSFLLSEHGFRLGIDTVRGAGHGLFGSKAAHELQAAGGPTTLQSLPYLGKETKAEAVRLAAASPVKMAWNQMKEMKIFDAYKTILMPIANASRMGEALRALDHGASTIEAAYAAQNVNGNYRMQGYFQMMRAFNYITMFSRPAIAAMDKTLERSGMHPYRAPRFNQTDVGQYFKGIHENPSNSRMTKELTSPRVVAAATMGLKGFVGITLPTMMMWYVNRDDEEINQVRRTVVGARYWFFRGDEGTIVRVRKPQVLGEIFGASAESMLDKMYKNDPDGTLRTLGALWDDVALNLMPQIGVIPASLMFNKNIGTGTPLVPGRDRNVDPNMQGRDNASLPSRVIADAAAPLSQDTNINALRTTLSPAGIDYILGTFAGMLGQDALRSLNAAIVYKNKGYLPAKEELPITARLFSRYPGMSVYEAQTFYKRDQKVQAAAGTIKEFAQQNPEMLADYFTQNRDRIMLIKLHDDVRQKIANFRRAIDDIKNMPEGIVDREVRESTIKSFTQQILNHMKVANDYAKQVKEQQ